MSHLLFALRIYSLCFPSLAELLSCAPVDSIVVRVTPERRREKIQPTNHEHRFPLNPNVNRFLLLFFFLFSFFFSSVVPFPLFFVFSPSWLVVLLLPPRNGERRRLTPTRCSLSERCSFPLFRRLFFDFAFSRRK